MKKSSGDSSSVLDQLGNLALRNKVNKNALSNPRQNYGLEKEIYIAGWNEQEKRARIQTFNSIIRNSKIFSANNIVFVTEKVEAGILTIVVAKELLREGLSFLMIRSRM